MRYILILLPSTKLLKMVFSHLGLWCLVLLIWNPSCISLASDVTCSGIVPMRHRDYNVSIADFGGVGDGVTLNTEAFKAAIHRIEHLNIDSRRGGTLLYIPPGEYLTAPFNLTSRMTLYLATNAVIKATLVLLLSTSLF